MKLKQVIDELKKFDKEWQKDKELQQIIDKLKKEFNKGSDVGFNSQEQEAYDHGYIQKYFKNYLPAKQRLLEAIGKAEVEKDDNKKTLLNAAHIYVYTLFENTWFGYLAADADYQVSIFAFKDKEPVIFTNSYRNHLPSFKSAILHFGACRDLFFPLLKLFNDLNVSYKPIKYNRNSNCVKSCSDCKESGICFHKQLTEFSSNNSDVFYKKALIFSI